MSAIVPAYPAIPHFSWPFVVDVFAQQVDVVEQDTTDEVAACVSSIVFCPVNACPELPGFGVPDPTFAQAPVDMTDYIDAVTQQEPRASSETVSEFMDTLGNTVVQIEMPYAGDPQQQSSTGT